MLEVIRFILAVMIVVNFFMFIWLLFKGRTVIVEEKLPDDWTIQEKVRDEFLSILDKPETIKKIIHEINDYQLNTKE